MAARATQVVIEGLAGGPAGNARASQMVLEGLAGGPAGNARASQLSLQVLVPNRFAYAIAADLEPVSLVGAMLTSPVVPAIDVRTPPVPTWPQDDFATNFQALLPRGRAWPRDLDALQTAVMAALTPTYVRTAAAAAALIADIFPPTTDDLLTEWESALGLPDPCSGEAPTTQGRVAQVVARFIAGGGQSISFYALFAANLGFSISVTQYTPLRFGQTFNLPMYDDAWAFVWVSAIVSAGSTLPSVLKCEFERLAPAHTLPFVTVSGAVI